MWAEPTLRRFVERLPEWASVRLTRLLDSDFARKVAETMATRVILIAVGLVTSVMIARSLGPAGRGLQASIAAITAIGVQFGNLGLHSSNTYYVAKKPALLPTLVGNTLAVGLGIATAVTLGVYAVMTAWPSLSPLDGTLLLLALAGIPLGLTYLLVQNLLLGIHEVRTYNVIELGSRIAVVALLGLLILAKMVSVEAVTVVGLATVVVSVAWALARIWPHLASPPRVSLSTVRDHLRYGFKAYVASFFAYTVIRADVLLCSYILGAEPTGQYSIAVSMADLVYMLPVVAGTIAFPRLTATEDPGERWAKTKSMTKWVALVLIALALVAAALARPAVQLLYGEAFLPSVGAFLWLLPGIVLLGINTILMNYFAAEGMPPIAIWSPAMASVVNVALNLLLLPRFGMVGASLASTVAYGMMLAMSVGYLGWAKTRTAA